MTLFEVLNALCFIEKQVTNAHFATNVTKIDSNIEGNWKDWLIKFHTKEEVIDEDKLDKLAWYEAFRKYDIHSETENIIQHRDGFVEGFKAGYRKAMEEQL